MVQREGRETRESRSLEWDLKQQDDALYHRIKLDTWKKLTTLRITSILTIISDSIGFKIARWDWL